MHSPIKILFGIVIGIFCLQSNAEGNCDKLVSNYNKHFKALVLGGMDINENIASKYKEAAKKIQEAGNSKNENECKKANTEVFDILSQIQDNEGNLIINKRQNGVPDKVSIIDMKFPNTWTK